MQLYRVPFWKSSPFTRLLVPMIAGIILQWYTSFSVSFIFICISSFLAAFLLLELLSIGVRFKLKWLQGFLLNLAIASFSMFIVWQKNIRHDPFWYGHQVHPGSRLIVRIDEPVIEKERTFKAEGFVEAVVNEDSIIPAKGKLLLYFLKDSNFIQLHYGDRILIDKPLQRIRNSGNPGAFDYERFAAFQQLFHNVYLNKNEWELLKGRSENGFRAIIFSIREYVIETLKKYISGGMNEKGIAEALLIGYKADLDRDLVQAYSNTGVVHIIAISGLHLGLIYVMLTWILNRIPFARKNKFIQLLLLLGCLWLFSILTGASASVLRSAVMFTFIVIGKHYFKRPEMINSLAGSAFFLLCYDPFFLWDVGFQLSYLALLGLVLLQQPLYRSLFIKQKWLDKIWSMLSVTLAAQVTTFPACIYYFHQFPNLFFITNLLAVPLSTVILFAELLLVAVSGWHFAARLAGKLAGALIWLMNRIITSVNGVSFSVWDRIHADLLTTWSLYFLITAACVWLINKNKRAFHFALVWLLIFTGLQVLAKLKLNNQVKLIVYNIPKFRAIDFVYRDKYLFVGDSALLQDNFLQNFHLKPARAFLQLKYNCTGLPNLYNRNGYYVFFHKKIILINSDVVYEPAKVKVAVDVLVISGNPAISIPGIFNTIKPSMVVLDASNSLWKIAKWKKECLALALPCFSTPEQGAFMMTVD